MSRQHKFKSRGEVRTDLEHRRMRIVTGGSREAADKALARGIPPTDHWGLVATEGTADRGEVGTLIGSASWDQATGLVHVTMLDQGEIPPKGRQARVPGPEFTRFTIRLKTESELPEYLDHNEDLFTRFASGRKGGVMTVDGHTYTGSRTPEEIAKYLNTRLAIQTYTLSNSDLVKSFAEAVQLNLGEDIKALGLELAYRAGMARPDAQLPTDPPSLRYGHEGIVNPE